MKPQVIDLEAFKRGEGVKEALNPNEDVFDYENFHYKLNEMASFWDCYASEWLKNAQLASAQPDEMQIDIRFCECGSGSMYMKRNGEVICQDCSKVQNGGEK